MVLSEIVDALARDAAEYGERYRDVLDAERGGVPLSLAAVLGASHQGGGWFWELTPTEARRLRGPRRDPSGALEPVARLLLWAGRRLLNDAGELAGRWTPYLAEVRDWSGYWFAALLVRALGSRYYRALLRVAGDPRDFGALLDVPEQLEAVVGPRLAPGVSRRIATARVRLTAAELLEGRLLLDGPARLVPAPDARARARVARVAGAGGRAAHVAHVAVAAGVLPVPDWFDVPSIGAQKRHHTYRGAPMAQGHTVSHTGDIHFHCVPM